MQFYHLHSYGFVFLLKTKKCLFYVLIDSRIYSFNERPKIRYGFYFVKETFLILDFYTGFLFIIYLVFNVLKMMNFYVVFLYWICSCVYDFLYILIRKKSTSAGFKLVRGIGLYKYSDNLDQNLCLAVIVCKVVFNGDLNGLQLNVFEMAKHLLFQKSISNKGF